MSHDNLIYPMSASGPTRIRNSRWSVQEEPDDHREDGGNRLLDLTDTIQTKLSTAEALAWVLHGSEHHPTGAEKVTAGVIAELIHEALQACDRQWRMIREYGHRKD